MKLQHFLIMLACLSLTASSAQDAPEALTVELSCFDTKELFSELKNTYQEKLIITGIANDEAKSIMSIWMDPKTNSWTIVATKENTSCVIGTGVDLKIVPTKRGLSV